MSPVWDADNELDCEQAAQLIDAQFPELAPADLTLLGVGWDNAAFVVNDVYVFRFPRRQLGATLLRQERCLLPQIAPLASLSVPLPEYFGQPMGSYPYEFIGYRMIAGVTACRVDWTEELRAVNAPRIAEFLRTLHAMPVSAEDRSEWPGDEIRRADVRWRAPKIRERLGLIRGLLVDGKIERGRLTDSDVTDAADWVERLADTPPSEEPPCRVHGDLYARHLLVDQEQCICGVIDWGDMHLGDRALDLSIVYSFLPPEARGRFWDAYGEADSPIRDRARFRAISYGALLIDYGADVGDAPILEVGRDALRYAVRGS
jgi:aminoglycoside phosphotransferase (APT) family kinase protein